MVSVIVPVYNVEKCLRRCIDSILRQTYTNFELILIDDGSTDGSGAICDEYARKDNRIKVIHRENGGLSAARNSGLEVMTGEYVTFIDSDDYVTDNYIEYMYTLMVENKGDISAVSHEMIFDDTENGLDLNENSVLSYDQKDIIKELLKMTDAMGHMAWGKLYKEGLFNDIRYPEGKLYEDLAVIYDILLKADRVVVSDARLYKYYIRTGSIMQSSFDCDRYYEVDIIDEKMDMIERVYPDLKTLCRARRVYSYLKTVHRIMSSKNRSDFDAYQKELKHKIKKVGKGLIAEPGINKSLKVKLAAFKFGVNAYEMVQRISDVRKQRKAGHRYVV